MWWDVLWFISAFTFPVSFFWIFPALGDSHLLQTWQWWEEKIQFTRVKFVYLYREAFSSFPTCCNEHRGRGSWCITRSSWKWLNPSFHSKFGFFGHSWASKLSPAMSNKRFQSLWALKKTARGTTSNWSPPPNSSSLIQAMGDGHQLSKLAAGIIYMGKFSGFPWEQLDNFNCKRHNKPWGERPVRRRVTTCHKREWEQEGFSRKCQAVWAAVLKVLAIILKFSHFSSPRGRQGQGPAGAVTLMLGAIVPMSPGISLEWRSDNLAFTEMYLNIHTPLLTHIWMLRGQLEIIIATVKQISIIMTINLAGQERVLWLYVHNCVYASLQKWN